MKDYYRSPQVEEGIHNIVLQNRCGNRLTLLCHESDCELEFVYKPNAFRRREFSARNFSTRDNFTKIFRDVRWPDIKASGIRVFDYDPFRTGLETRSESGAENRIDIVNLAEDNAFAVSARCPLLIAVKPHGRFEESDGLLVERFTDRGEDISSFLSFPGYGKNRYRVLENGTHVIQLMENDIALFGAEENRYQIERTLKKFAGMKLNELVEENEAAIEQRLDKGRVIYGDPVWQRVFDLNRRIVFSGLDEGGACFGAINRIYHLIWVRDGSMTANHMALAGNPDFLRIWAPFLLANPSVTMQEDGSLIPEFTQMLGTRWTKSEDDGIFYAAWTCFTHFQTTGNDALLNGPGFQMLLECIDRNLDKCWNPELEMVGSDTLGEESLCASPYHGYDIVNGKFSSSSHRSAKGRENIDRCHSLYHQVNVYNVLLMARCLLAQRPDLGAGRKERYRDIARKLAKTLSSKFVAPDKQLYSLCMTYRDGSEEWIPWGPDCDHWEHAWAVSQGPFFPVPAKQLSGARLAVATWEDYKSYGYCPWNVLARSLAEHGMSSEDYAAMLKDEISEAMLLTEKYPLRGALTEYHGQTESWRGLPFSAGSLIVSNASQLLQTQALGLTVRGGSCVDQLENFQWRLSRIDAEAEGKTTGVTEYELNGACVKACLQIPERLLIPGRNKLKIKRGNAAVPVRIYSSDAALVGYTENSTSLTADFDSPVEKTISIERLENAESSRIFSADGKELDFANTTLPDTPLSALHCPHPGRIRIELKWK